MRAPLELTRRGWGLLGATSGLIVAGRLLGTVELSMLGVAGLALLATAALWVRGRTHPVLVQRAVHPARVHVGGDARVDLEVVAPASGPTPQTTVTDDFDGGRRAARFLVPALDRRQRARAAYRVPTGRRGRFTIGPAVLGVTDPFGLARRSWTAGDVDEITICPRVVEIRSPIGAPGRRRDVSPFAVRFHAPSIDGEEFLTLREYAVGDDLRRIHWRSTARTGELVVRQDEAQWQPRALVLLDTRADAHDDVSFEAAVEATASVVARLGREHLPFDLLTTDGRSFDAAVMDHLAVIEPARPHGLGRALAPLRPGTRRGLLVAVMGALDPAGLEAVATLGGPSAPLTLVLTRPTELGRQAPAVAVVDGRAGEFARSWDEAMLSRGHARLRAGRR